MAKTADYYHSHPKAYKAKLKTDKIINARPEQRKKRSFLVKENRKRGTYGNGDGLDVSHPRPGKKGVTLEKQSSNRGANEKSRLIGSKRRGYRVKRKKKRK